MRNYIQEIDENFVADAIREFLTKNWFVQRYVVKKKDNCWKVLFKMREGENYHILYLTNFDVFLHEIRPLNKMHVWSEYFDITWQAALYGKFGEEYFWDLKQHILKHFSKKDISKHLLSVAGKKTNTYVEDKTKEK